MSVSLSNLKYGAHNDDVKEFQTALKAHHYSPGPADGIFGRLTKAACAAFQRAQGWSGSEADGIPGVDTVAALGLVLAVPVPAPPADDEPPADYTRVQYTGKTVNVRTRVLLDRAAATFGHALYLTQGSYNTGVAASAGTHDGGGVVDVSISGWTVAQQWDIVRALRVAGFAAWRRTPAEGFAYHIHACAIGDREMAPLARSQVSDYFAGKNGLANHGPDSAPATVGRPYPSWAAKYK